MTARHLAAYLEESAGRFPSRAAAVMPDGTSMTYAELDSASAGLAAFLSAKGVQPGDRVAVALPKSLPAVVSLFGVMKARAAYVPIDVTAPAERAQRVMADAGVRAIVGDSRTIGLAPVSDASGSPVVRVQVAEGDVPVESGLARFRDVVATPASRPAGERPASDLAYILYTSGSTGVPKGVMLTHENASSFVEWGSRTFAPTEGDRFSSHAPFHFDLSVLDLYVAIKHGATVFLIPDALGKNPKELAAFIESRRLTVWYSTPSILTMLVQLGNLQGRDLSALRLVLFAGEVFPVKHLRDLKQLLPAPVYYNLYGPTETNVCTFARIPDDIPSERTAPYPIGFLCDHCRGAVLDEALHDAPKGEEGLLYIAGPSLFQGYWNRPAENAAAFAERGGERWYNTGDVVTWNDDEGYIYRGRRDRMVKRRGYRIELGEIERALYTHPSVREAAVISVSDADAVRIVAFVSCAAAPPTIVELKTFCAAKLPGYMTPDQFIVRDSLPRTSTDKVDYQTLKSAAAPASSAT